MYSQPAILLLANPTALSRPMQPTESAKYTGHPTLNSGSIKIMVPEATPDQILARRLGGDYPKCTTAHQGFHWKINYSLSVFCRMSKVQPAPDLHSHRGVSSRSPAVFDGKARTSSRALKEKSVP